MGIILASQSPRRKELLQKLGLQFEIKLAQHDETMDPGAMPADEVARVSRLKAEAVRGLCSSEDIIIAADTIVVCEGKIMGKPKDEADAFQMLRRLSGKEHQVMTGWTVMQGERADTKTEISSIRFRELEDREICAYIATGEPMDKAGAYAVQGLASVFITGLVGDYYNVVGLPVCALAASLKEFGIRVL